MLLSNWYHASAALAIICTATANPLATRADDTCVLGRPRTYICGAPGNLTNVDTTAVLTDSTAASLAECRDSCLSSRLCLTFWFDSSSKRCVTSTKALRLQGFRRNTKSTTTLYHRQCWSGSGCPPRNLVANPGFELEQFNTGSKYWIYGPGYSIKKPNSGDDVLNFRGINGQRIASQDVPTVPAKYYTFEFDINTCPNAARNSMALGDLVVYVPTTNGQDRRVKHLVRGEGQGDKLILEPEAPPFSTCDIYWDDFLILPANAVSENPAAGATSVIKSGDFPLRKNDWVFTEFPNGNTEFIMNDENTKNVLRFSATDPTRPAEVLFYQEPDVEDFTDYIITFDYRVTAGTDLDFFVILGQVAPQGQVDNNFQRLTIPTEGVTEFTTYKRRVTALKDSSLDTGPYRYSVDIVVRSAGNVEMINFAYTKAE